MCLVFDQLSDKRRIHRESPCKYEDLFINTSVGIPLRLFFNAHRRIYSFRTCFTYQPINTITMSASLSPPMVATREEWAEKLASHMKTVDPKWIEVDDFISSTLHHEEEVDVSGLLNRAADAGLPPIAASASITSLMGLHAYASSTTHALEIGTLAGLTSIRLAKANPQLHVTTVELHDLYADVARANIKEAGLEDRIEVVVGQAADVLPRLAAEIRAGKREKFGLTFIDADSVSRPVPIVANEEC